MILITGGAGRLCSSLRKVFPTARCTNRSDLEINDASSIRRAIETWVPELVIHCAAFTDVRRAESQQAACWETNVRGTERLVNQLKTCVPECYFVYVSSACVFRGDVGNYSEEDIPYPKNFYGLSKLIGEYSAGTMRSHLIVRTNFVAKEAWPFPRAFIDRFGTYLFADDVALAIKNLVDAKMTGLVHVAGDKRMSMFDLARISSPDVGEMTMADVDVPLTIDMSLCSKRIEPYRIGSAELI